MQSFLMKYPVKIGDILTRALILTEGLLTGVATMEISCTYSLRYLGKRKVMWKVWKRCLSRLFHYVSF